ncbi:hypothetical protein SMD11_7040 [Streptomyces albireticuli]|uniref:Uncharacterized protein n=1 Tax=Streptomyces albireticuli TaxID=1940 RepID=A0A1Z2LE76_9ACTN|nr:hypothetical protein [Streptomyces albireticuli]ARZ72616.1 hypothetical protein SMD11_7040 [Streptomyces albireticuli]
MTDPHQLIIAAAQAAGPCPPRLEAAWHNRVRAIALNLHLDGMRLAADIARIQATKDRVRGIPTRVEIEESSNRGFIYVKALGRGEERLRADRLENDSGQQLYALAQRLVGRLVRVYKTMESVQVKDGDRPANRVRVAVHLVDPGPADGDIAESDAKDLMIQTVGGNTERAATAWQAAGLPSSGPIPQDQLERALAAVRPTDGPAGLSASSAW